MSSSPWIPPELICLILTNLWDSLQTSQERSAFMRVMATVNRTWLTLVAFITSRDVHIDARAFLKRISRSSRIPGADDLLTAKRAYFANSACRSITFYVGEGVPSSALHGPSCPEGIGQSCAIAHVIRTISAPGHAPNLQHIALRYTDQWLSDAFTLLEYCPFPPQVSRLSIDYTFAKFSSPSTQDKMWLDWITTRDVDRRYAPRLETRRRAIAASLPPIRTIRHLALSGVKAPYVIAILQVCPGVETLEIAEPSSVRLFEVAPLPPATTTVVLRHPGAVFARLIRQWDLGCAVEQGLFSACGAALRIVVRSGTPDPVAFEEARCGCER